MYFKKRSLFFLMLLCCLVLSACGGQESENGTEKVEGLAELGEIQVIAREEGSGTREAFAQMVGLEADGAENANADQTREDARIAGSGEAVTEEIAQTQNGIGYVSAAAAEEDGVKVLQIEGVSPGEEAVEKGDYPLSRSFYLVYSGTLSDLDQDFVNYINTAGQEVVARSYVPVKEAGTFLSNKEPGKIHLTGSTSIAPLIEELVEGYNEYNPNAQIEVTETDSTQGLNAAMQGKCDLAMSSRELESYEKELLEYEAFAKDGIAVIVNKENPLENLSLEQLKEIFDGSLKNWDEL